MKPEEVQFPTAQRVQFLMSFDTPAGQWVDGESHVWFGTVTGHGSGSIDNQNH